MAGYPCFDLMVEGTPANVATFLESEERPEFRWFMLYDPNEYDSVRNVRTVRMQVIPSHSGRAFNRDDLRRLARAYPYCTFRGAPSAPKEGVYVAFAPLFNDDGLPF